MMASVCVGDLLPSVTENELFSIFQAAGNVSSVRVCRDHATRQSLGYAYVNFQSAEDGQKAIEMLNCSLIADRPCSVTPIRRDPLIRKGSAGNVFIRGLAKSVDSKSLQDTFAKFGKVSSCKVKTNRKGESMGFGYIQFAQEADAELAISKANGMLLMGETIELTKFKARQDEWPTRIHRKPSFDPNSPLVLEGVCLFVKNFGSNVTNSELEKLFSPVVGKCMAQIKLDKLSGLSKETASVFVADQESANKAVAELNGKKGPGDKPLYVAIAQKRERRTLSEKSFTRAAAAPASQPTPMFNGPLLQSRPMPAPTTVMSPFYSPQFVPSIDPINLYPGLPAFSSPNLNVLASPLQYPLPTNGAFPPSFGTSFSQGVYRVLHPTTTRGGRRIVVPPVPMSSFQAAAAGAMTDYWRLCPLVSQLYPGCGANITNRLLAKEHTNVNELLTDPDVLKVKADEAFKEMQSSQNWKSELWNCLYPLVCALHPVDPTSIIFELAKADVAEGAALLTDTEKLRSRVMEVSEVLQKRREAGIDWNDTQSIAMAVYPRIAVAEGLRAPAILQLMLQDKESIRGLLQSDEKFKAKVAEISTELLKKDAEASAVHSASAFPIGFSPLPLPASPAGLYPFPLGSPVLVPFPTYSQLPSGPLQTAVPMLGALPPSRATPTMTWTDKQSIGEAIYPKINALIPTQSGKVTGMLLELGNAELTELYLHPEALAEKVKEALTVLVEVSHVDQIDWNSKTAIKDALLLRVQAIELEKGPDITAKLLEKEPSELRRLVGNKDLLREQVLLLAQVIHTNSRAKMKDWSSQDKTAIGDYLLAYITPMHPTQSGIIVAKLLETDLNELRRMLNNETALRSKIELVAKLLREPRSNRSSVVLSAPPLS